MKIIAWNIKGLGQPRKQKGLGKLIRLNDAKVCGILETKIHDETFNLDRFMDSYLYGWNNTSNFHIDRRGRIFVVWDPNFVDMEVISVGVQHIACLMTNKETSDRCGVCFIYGLHSVVHRRGIWEALTGILGSHDLPWVILGDFNNVKNYDERINGKNVTYYECRDMMEACTTLGLTDSPYTSNDRFTWMDKKKIFSKIDRVLLNSNWMNERIFCHTHYPEMWHLSDHKPAIVSLYKGDNRRKKSFKFQNMWCVHENFNNIVKEGWTDAPRGSYQFRLCSLLKNLRKPLSKLHNSQFSHLAKQVEVANSCVCAAMEKVRDDPSETHIAGLNQAKKKADFINKVEYTFLQQHTKANYLRKSDKCNKFFHSLMRSNRRKAHIGSILRRDGEPTSSSREIASEFTSFFKGLFGARGHTTPADPSLFAQGDSVKEEDKAMLVAPVSNEEIKRALWSIGDDKAPGPDGYTAKFFKDTWEITGREMCSATKEFFANSTLLKQVNRTVVSLIPKTEEAN